MGYFLCITESAIIEDPSVIYEGGVYLPEPVTLENYLVYLSKCYNIYVEFCNFKRCFVLPYCVDGKPMSLEIKHVVSYLSFMLQVPFDFIDFSKDFLEGKIDLEENSDKDEVYTNIFVTFLKMKSSNMLVSIFVNCHFSTGSKGYTDSIMVDNELCFMINGGHLS